MRQAHRVLIPNRHASTINKPFEVANYMNRSAVNRLAKPRLWNRLNLHSLPLESVLPDAFLTELSRLGIDSANTPFGLLPAVNELLVQHGMPFLSFPMELLEIPGNTVLLDNEALGALQRHGHALVLTDRFTDPVKLIQRLAQSFPSADVVVFAKNRVEGIGITNALRADGHSAWYMEKEFPCRNGKPPIQHRMRITSQNKLAIADLRLHATDIIVRTEAQQFIRNDYFCHHTELFNPRKGTFFNPRARLLGIAPADTHPRDMLKVYSVFGMRTFELTANGMAYAPPTVDWLTRDKTYTGNQNLGPAPSILDQKKEFIWNNQKRNACVLRHARKAVNSPGGSGAVAHTQDSPMGSVGIVVESELHRNSLAGSQAAWGAPCPVYTFDDIRNNDHLPSILIRADGGTGLLPIKPQASCVRVLDIKDQASHFLRTRTKQRKAAYSRQWLLGSTPYLAKLEWMKAKIYNQI